MYWDFRAATLPLRALACAGALCWLTSPALGQTGGTSALTAELFYQTLLGELQAQAGEPGAAYSLLLDAARKTQDNDLFKRATDIALHARSGESALAAAQAWAQAQPQTAEAHRYVLQILLALNRVQEAGKTLGQLLHATPFDQRAPLLDALPTLLTRGGDKAAALAAAEPTLRQAADDIALAAVAWTSLGRLQWANQQGLAALTSCQQALARNPTHAPAALLALELMERAVPGAADEVERYLKAAPDQASLPYKLTHIRVLLDQQRLQTAQERLTTLLSEAAVPPEAWFLQGQLLQTQRHWSAAEAAYQKYLTERPTQDRESPLASPAQAYLHLALLAEKQGQFDKALTWLDKIEGDEALAAALTRRATLLAHQGRLEEGVALLRQQPERTPLELRRKLRSEAQLLRDMGLHERALQAYARATMQFPEDPDLPYEQAVVAEKAGQLAEMERLLRSIMAQHPELPHAYNALGYALADRNERLTEAKTLIQMALERAPNDAFIQDSLGWVEFRLGNTHTALSVLERAYRQQPDTEIAAHLGEVHWALGQRDAALKVWREGLLLNPENDTLRSTLKRLDVQP
jgi:tetratricopeptide (TPR) repeat protein